MADQMSREQFMSLFNQGAPAPAGDADRRQQWISVMQGPVEKESMPLLDVGAQAVTNLIPSAIKYGQDIYGAVTNPAQTVKGLTQLMQAGFQSITPDVIAELIYDPQKAAAAGETAKAVGDYYRNRYGTVENFKQSVAQDPVGVMGDLSTVLAATGGGVKMAATLPGLAPDGRLASLGRNISTVSEYIDPLQGTGKLAAATGTKALGALTGVGPETVQGAAQAGFRGDKNFLSGMRGTSGDQALENAKHNLNVMRQNRANAYRSGMVDIKNDKTILDLADIEKQIANAEKSNRIGTKVIDDSAQAVIDTLKKEISDWKSSGKADPNTYLTPEGLDGLKQRIGSIVGKIDPRADANASRVGNGVYNSVKETIVKQAPTYAKVMKDYSEASDALREIEKTFSLKQGGSVDTAMRKLQSITRNNVNTNYGQRLTLAQQLEQEGGRPFISMLQGEAMSGKSARGLAGVGEGATILGGAFYNPAFLAALPFQTPRVVGEGAYAGGRAARVASAPFRALGVTSQDINTIGTLARPFSEQNEEFRPINLADFYRQSQER